MHAQEGIKIIRSSLLSVADWPDHETKPVEEMAVHKGYGSKWLVCGLIG